MAKKRLVTQKRGTWWKNDYCGRMTMPLVMA